jgi:hypothetical protein
MKKTILGLALLGGLLTACGGDTVSQLSVSTPYPAVPVAAPTDPPTMTPTPSITCTFKVAWADGTSIIERKANVGGWTDANDTTPVDCQSLRMKTAGEWPNFPPTVTFATDPTTPPLCEQSVNGGVIITIWSNVDLATAKQQCVGLTGKE